MEIVNSINKEETNASYKGITLKTLYLVLLSLSGGILTYIFTPKLVSDSWGYITIEIVAVVVSVGLYIIHHKIDCLHKLLLTPCAICQGVALGCLTKVVDVELNTNVGMYAVLSTFIIFFVVLVLYLIGLFKLESLAFERFIVVCSVALIVAAYAGLLQLFVDFEEALPWFMLAEIIIIIFTAIELVMDFEEADEITQYGEKSEEWHVAGKLSFSLFTLYVEIIKLIVMIIGDNTD